MMLFSVCIAGCPDDGVGGTTVGISATSVSSSIFFQKPQL